MEILQIILTSAASLVVLFLLAKLMGNKQVSQLTMLDYIVGISIGSIAAEMATDLESPLNSLTAMVTYGLIAAGASLVSQHSLRARKVISGKPLILLDNGKLYRKNMKKGRIDLSEFLMQCRSQGYFDLNQIETAVMEFNGNISILPASSDRPLTPNDMKLDPQQDKLTTAVIMDGHINEQNLKVTGNNEIWLKKQLHELGYNNEKEVFLAMCDNNNVLTAFGYEQ